MLAVVLVFNVANSCKTSLFNSTSLICTVQLFFNMYICESTGRIMILFMYTVTRTIYEASQVVTRG